MTTKIAVAILGTVTVLLAAPVKAQPSGRGGVSPLPSTGVSATDPQPISNRSVVNAWDWPKYCNNVQMTGVANNETRISVASAPTFTLLWTKKLGGTTASQPIVVNNVVHMGDWGGNEWAIDADTGNTIASVNLGTTAQPQCNPPNLGVTSAPLISAGTLYVAGGADYFYALDPQTLNTNWKTYLGDNTNGYYGWCSPTEGNVGMIIQGIASNCDNPTVHGMVVGMDNVSGEITCSADLNMTTDPAHFGAGQWSSPAVDFDNGWVFVTTGSAYHYTDGLTCSVVRLALSDLSIQDYWKVSLEIWNEIDQDADFGCSATLFVDANGRQLFGTGHKDGIYYAFDRANLAAGPVWATQVAMPGACPQCSQGDSSTAAFDGTRLYTGGGAPSDESGSSSGGTVEALDPTTGAILWRYVDFNGPVIAPISYGNGVVFAAGGTKIVALNAATGVLLWSATGAGFYGGIAISNGRIFVGDLAGNLYAYAIPTQTPGP